MRDFIRSTGIALLALLAAAAPAFAGGSVTVGLFYTELGKAERLSAVDPASVEANLRSAGFQLPSLRFDKSLTEADLVAISNALGLSITSSRGTAPVSELLMTQFLTSFGAQLGATKLRLNSTGPTNGNGPKDLPPQADNGKGKKKGHNKSSSEPI